MTACAPPLLLHEDREPEIGWGVLRLASGTQKARHPVSAERLERGILLGRYERCGLTIGGLGRVSRAAPAPRAHRRRDLGDRRGEHQRRPRRGRPVTAIVLEPRDDLLLADELAITWTREVHPQA